MHPPTTLTGRVGRWSARHRKLAIVGWLLFVVIAFMAGGAVGTDQLDQREAGVGDSGTAAKVHNRAFPKTSGEGVFLSSTTLDRGDPAFRAAVTDVARRLRRVDGVSDVESPYGDGGGRFAKDGHAAMVGFTIRGDSADKAVKAVADRAVDAVATVERAHPSVRVEPFGDATSGDAFERIFQDDLSKAEKLSLPITLVILLATFGTLLVAGVPLLLAMSAVLATFGLIGPISQLAPVDESISNVVLLIGLAVGVDYSLFYIRRAREERAAGRSPQQALDVAAATSGHSVLVSGVTVMVAMAGMYLAGAPTFTSFATGTIVVVAVAMLASLTVLPALLSLMGDRVNRPSRIPGLRRVKAAAGRLHVWSRVVDAVTRRPVLWGGLAATLLVAMAIPATQMHLGTPPLEESLPQDKPVVQTFNHVREAFPVETSGAEIVVKAADVTAPRVTQAIGELERRAARTPRLFPGEDGVDVEVSPDRRVAVLGLEIAGDGQDERSNDALDALRGDLVPATLARVPGMSTWVGGMTAQERDFNRTLARNLPYVIGFVLLAAFLLLLVTFRSVVVPLKAIVLNLLSVGAAYGAMVLVFQHGWFKGLLGFSQTGPIVAWLPLFLFVVLFGLSMDYHVFILSRVREAYDSGMRTQDAVRHAIRNTAGVVTSAAVVMVAVFSIFGSLSFLSFKQMGVGLALAVLIDATLIRGVLLPASMQLLGDRNWWLPRRLGWLPRLGARSEVAPATR
ncbi:MAG TPA: MMPL family transporter [Solirubrobacteraceae bacterium]|jgi:RND superfamily putative drug exporter